MGERWVSLSEEACSVCGKGFAEGERVAWLSMRDGWVHAGCAHERDVHILGCPIPLATEGCLSG